jgi:thioredoxin-related protein
MKTLILSTLIILFSPQSELDESSLWLNNYDEAIAKAKEEQKPVLLSFAGSDWCKPCIMLTREVFENDVFKTYASENLVLLLLDFPRLKKNQLSEDQIKHNESMAAKYNKDGEFPLVVIIDADGKVIAKTGFQKGGAENFVNYLKTIL